MKKIYDDIDQIDQVEKYFTENKVKIVKMNHCFNDQGFTQYEGFI